MKKIDRRSFLAVCGAVAAAGVLTACGGSSSSSTAASSSTASSASSASSAASSEAALSGTVSTGGSTSMNSVIEALTEGFAEIAPDVTVSYDPTGSGAGITGALEQTLDIGLASRALHDDETGVTATTVALDGIAMVVNNENPVSDLSIEQLAQIFTKEITNWADVGGEDGEIVVIGREAGSGTRDGFESIVGVEDACVYDQELTATGAVISAVASNKLAIGHRLRLPVRRRRHRQDPDRRGCRVQRGHRPGWYLQGSAPLQLHHQRLRRAERCSQGLHRLCRQRGRCRADPSGRRCPPGGR